MARMYLAFLLDFFQPVTQDDNVIDEVANECYFPLVELFNCDLGPRFTVSLANSLAGILARNGKVEVIDQLRRAMKAGKVELVHTGAYHPIFPLIPLTEVERQIKLDIGFKKEDFELTEKRGLVPPELCYEDRLTALYKQLGFRWTITDDRIMGINGIEIPEDTIYQVAGLVVLMRSSLWSDWIGRPSQEGRYLTGRDFIHALEREAAGRDLDAYKIIALSGETFGHHIKYYQETFLRDMLFALQESSSVELCLLSELLDKPTLTRKEKVAEKGKGFRYFPPTSWATHPEDHLRSDPFPHWKSNGNPIHERLWDLTTLILQACQDIDFRNDVHDDLRRLLDRAFYSTQYYWASFWFWRPEQVHKGIDMQMRALYKCAELTNNPRLLDRGQAIYASLMWDIHERTKRQGAAQP